MLNWDSDNCTTDFAGGYHFPVLNTDAEIVSWDKVGMAGWTKGPTVCFGYPQPFAHRNLLGKHHVPVGKNGICTILICLIEKNFNSFQRDILCNLIFSVFFHVFTMSPEEVSRDDRKLPADRHKTAPPPRGVQCVPVQESVCLVFLHRHHPKLELPSA